MPMKFRCTACTARLHVPTRWAGTTIECPKCATRVVVPFEPPESQPAVRFEERSLEKRIAAFEEATAAAVNAAVAMASGTSVGDGRSSAGWPAWETGPRTGPGLHRGADERRTVVIPGFWIPLLAAVVLAAIAIAAAAGFWAGWLASQGGPKAGHGEISHTRSSE